MQRRRYALIKQPALDNLADTVIGTEAAGDVLYFDGTNWINTPYAELVDDRVSSLLVAGNNIDLTYDDGTNSLTVAVEALTSADIGDFSEAVDDRLAALIVAGNNIDVTYNDVSNTFTIDVEGLTSADISDFSEAVDDRVSALLVAGTNITLTYNDASNTLTIAATGGGGGGTVTHNVNGRLTLTSGTPVTTADVTGATNIYFTPFNGQHVTLWNGSAWADTSFSETTLALGTLTSGKPYDVFGYLSGGALALEALVWTNDTTRATAVTLQDGRYCKSGDKTRLYLGTFYTTSTTTTEDSLNKRYLFNQYNRTRRICANPLETTNSWTYTTATWRQARASTSNQFEYVTGDPATMLAASCHGIVNNGLSAGTSLAVGIGIDSTSANSARYTGANVTSSDVNQVTAHYKGYPGVGRHYITWLEYSGAANTSTWFGDAGNAIFQSGLFGEVDL